MDVDLTSFPSRQTVMGLSNRRYVQFNFKLRLSFEANLALGFIFESMQGELYQRVDVTYV